MAEGASRLEIALLFAIGVAQGLALVTFPAASAIFTNPDGFALSSTAYGAMFIPQVAMAILAAALAPRLARRIGLKGVLVVGLCADLAAMLLLSSSALDPTSDVAFPLLCLATGALGLGFGAAVMALNTLVEANFVARADLGVLALNALLGLGTALAPLLVALFTMLGAWWALPMLLSALIAALLATTLAVPLRLSQDGPAGRGALPRRFWVYAGALLLYGVAETLLGNWGALYLSSQRHVAPHDASLALTAFWAAVTAGRLAVAGLARIVPARTIYVALPIVLALAFQAVAAAEGAALAILAFTLAGIGCSAFLPLSLSFGGTEFPNRSATMSGELIAVYQIGYGITAFGVGPLTATVDLPYSVVFAAGTAVALLMAVASAIVVARPR